MNQPQPPGKQRNRDGKVQLALAAAFLLLCIVTSLASNGLSANSDEKIGVQGMAMISFIAAVVLGIRGTYVITRELVRTFEYNAFIGLIAGILCWIAMFFTALLLDALRNRRGYPDGTTFGIGMSCVALAVVGGLTFGYVMKKRYGWRGFDVGMLLGLILVPLTVAGLCAMK